MKKCKFILFVIFIVNLLILSCNKSNVRYLTGNTDNLNNLIDSIEKSEMILIPDTSEWEEILYSSCFGTYREKTIDVKGPNKIYKLTISGDSIISYEYKVEIR